MPKSLAPKISLSFIPIIFAEGHIMNSSFVTIVPLYALYGHMTPVSVRWFYKVEACIIRHMSLYVSSHITAWTQGRSLLPALRNSSRFWPFPLFILLLVLLLPLLFFIISSSTFPSHYHHHLYLFFIIIIISTFYTSIYQLLPQPS